MSDQEKIPLNIELEPDTPDHVPDKELRYQPGAFDSTQEPFEPVVLETYPDGHPKSGICGRDSHGKPVIPPELKGAALLETPTGAELKNPRIHDRLVKLSKTTWPLFRNPPPETLAERDDWQDQHE